MGLEASKLPANCVMDLNGTIGGVHKKYDTHFDIRLPNAYGSLIFMEKSGICHAPNSTHYSQTKNFKLYKTLDDCLNSGERMPKK
jgi:hypothetical protein